MYVHVKRQPLNLYLIHVLLLHTLVPAPCILQYELQDQESVRGHPSIVRSASYISLQLSWLVVYHATPWLVLTESFSRLLSAVPRPKHHHNTYTLTGLVVKR